MTEKTATSSKFVRDKKSSMADLSKATAEHSKMFQDYAERSSGNATST